MHQKSLRTNSKYGNIKLCVSSLKFFPPLTIECWWLLFYIREEQNLEQTWEDIHSEAYITLTIIAVFRECLYAPYTSVLKSWYYFGIFSWKQQKIKLAKEMGIYSVIILNRVNLRVVLIQCIPCDSEILLVQGRDGSGSFRLHINIQQHQEEETIS